MREFRLIAGVVLAGLVTLGLASVAIAADGPARAEQLRHFESKVRPILVQRCVKCHGGEKQEGELRLDSPAAALRGGAAGPPVIAGAPDKSLLVSAVNYKDEALQMPPDGKLPAEEIAALVQWIQSGAAIPEEAGAPPPLKSVGDEQLAQGRQFWAFRAPGHPPVPAVAQSAWPRSPLDAFILARLESERLRPSPDADRAIWLRRATYDLLGLPPQPDDVRAFVADESPDARVRALDRLLASPRYGERWTRTGSMRTSPTATLGVTATTSSRR